MTTLENEQPYDCEFAIRNGLIVTVCDKQCSLCVEKNRTGDNHYTTTIGDKKEVFQIVLDKDYFDKKQQFKITSPIVYKYGKWYHKLLYYLTFKQRFIEGYEHEIELL